MRWGVGQPIKEREPSVSMGISSSQYNRPDSNIVAMQESRRIMVVVVVVSRAVAKSETSGKNNCERTELAPVANETKNMELV